MGNVRLQHLIWCNCINGDCLGFSLLAARLGRRLLHVLYAFIVRFSESQGFWLLLSICHCAERSLIRDARFRWIKLCSQMLSGSARRKLPRCAWSIY